MPIYTIENTITGEVEDQLLSISAMEALISDNPHLRQIIGAPNIIGGTGDRTRPPDGFKQVLSRVADANPTSALADDYGRKDKKSTAIRDSLKRVKKKLGPIYND
jgi:hypothetical protein